MLERTHDVNLSLETYIKLQSLLANQSNSSNLLIDNKNENPKSPFDDSLWLRSQREIPYDTALGEGLMRILRPPPTIWCKRKSPK